MLISKAMNEALNEQVGHEFGASMQYVAIACYFDGEGLPMLARHFFRQSEEERQHALKFVRYLLDAGGTVVVPAIPAQKASFSSAEEAVSLSRDWELTVTKQINAIMDRAISEKDHVTKHFLEWFMEEQLEEVSSMDTLLRMVKRAGERGLLFVENYLQGGKGVPGGHGSGDEDED
ncbi:MAG TPA: ferritin [Gemmatimonadaceae bacterium]|nr:ferritin [Gemmatimonadaceae bacterium]